MVILSQIVGTGGFSIVDNLRLIVIAAIFIGIVAVLLYLKFANSGGKTNGKYISKEKAGENIEDIAGSAEGTGEEPVVNSSEAIDEKIKNSEAEIITNFEAVIKDLRSKIDTKLTAETDDIRAELTTKIEQLISNIEERENVIDTKVQEALNKMNDRVGAALHSQKNSTASVLEKQVDSLRTEEVPAGDLAFGKAEKVVEEKIDCEEVEKKAFWNMLKETSVKDKGILGELASSVQTDETSVSDSSSDESKTAIEEVVVSEETKVDELEILSEDKTGVKLEVKESEEAVGESTDFDMQEFLSEEPISTSTSGGSEAVVDKDIVLEEIKEEELEGPSEDNANVELDERESGGTVGDSADFDIQEFLDELENLPSENDSETEK